MDKDKKITEEELKKISGGAQMFESYEAPTTCLVCGSPLTQHPTIGDINGFPLFACSKNVWDESHQVLWYRLEKK